MFTEWVKCSSRLPGRDDCLSYDGELDDYYGRFLVTVENESGVRGVREAYYHIGKNLWHTLPGDFTSVGSVVAWLPMVKPLAGEAGNSLAMFAGKSNPFDTLWYLSIEIGRVFLNQVKEMGNKESLQVDDASPLILEYSRLIQSVNMLSWEEKMFLYRDSKFNSGDFYGTWNKLLLSAGAESKSLKVTNTQLASKGYLVRTLGEEAGLLEYSHRQSLHKLAKIVLNDSILEDVRGYLLGNENFGKKPDVKAFLSKAKKPLTLWDVEYIQDVRKYSFSLED